MQNGGRNPKRLHAEDLQMTSTQFPLPNIALKNASVWQAIRLHYGFQCTGAHFIDLAAIKREPDERQEDLYQRLMAFTDDNLLHLHPWAGSGVIWHVVGVAILPSDFASRNAPECDSPTCQVCAFVCSNSNSIVRQITAEDVVRGTAKLPFMNRSAWLGLQAECSDLRRTCAYLRQGIRPSKKLTDIRDVKRYLNVATVAKDGLLIVRRHTPLAASTDCIVVPRSVLDGLLTSLHIKLNHPTTSQLKTVVQRYFYALDMDSAVQRVSSGCHQCAALRKALVFVSDQSTCDPPEVVGSVFAADVFRRDCQFILVVWECVTSFTLACLINDERKETLGEALTRLCVGLCPLDGPFTVIRTDPAPGFAALAGDVGLTAHRLVVEVDNAKNVNKNPVAERAIQEIQGEILRLEPNCRAVTPLLLSVATAHLNSRVRSRGLSSQEMLLQRDQLSHKQLPVVDQDLILKQHSERVANHPYSVKSKVPSGCVAMPPAIRSGDLVYLYGDRNKSRALDRYLVTSVDGSWCNIQKFTGTQLRRTSYRVRLCDCYKVEGPGLASGTLTGDLASDEDVDIPVPHCPDIPPAIAEPPPAPCPPHIDVVAEPLSALCLPHDGGTEPGDSPPGKDVPARVSDAAPRRSGRQRRCIPAPISNEYRNTSLNSLRENELIDSENIPPNALRSETKGNRRRSRGDICLLREEKNYDELGLICHSNDCLNNCTQLCGGKLVPPPPPHELHMRTHTLSYKYFHRIHSQT
ncbi:hypothetical protein ABVT39_006424 [Epinephelus coioides]